MTEGRSVLVGANPLAQESTRGGRGSSRGMGLFNELRLTEGQDERIVLVEGRYQNRFYDEDEGLVKTAVEPFFRYRRHAIPPMFQTPGCRKDHKTLDGKTRYVYLPCSAGPDPVNPKPCLPCQIGSEQTAARPRKVFTVVHLRKYHLIPRKNNPQETYPKMCLSDVSPERDCPACEQGYPTVNAARRYVEFTIPDYEVLVNHNQRLRNKCICGGKLGTTEFSCPQCGSTLLKFSSETKEEFAKVARTGKYYCQRCGVPVRVNELKACSNKCQSPQALDVFNTILTINKARTDKNFMQILIPETNPIGNLLPDIKALMEPLDLAATFAADLAEQRRMVAVSRSSDEELSELRSR